jgi:extracellular factor (EF) 3-hydroxypalmitic acid methyl ester biosynthesis protein
MTMMQTHEGSVSRRLRIAGTAHLDDGCRLLDRTLTQLSSTASEDETVTTFAGFVDALDDLRGSLDECQWRQLIRACRLHPLHRLLLQEEPYTRRAFMKPRGYAGDAEMLDYMYSGLANVPMNRRACALFRVLAWECDGARAVRARKDLIAHRLDEAASERARPRVFSLACGHLREADDAVSVRAGVVDYVAADQDITSLSEVERRLGANGVKTMHTSVRAILRGEARLHDYDLVYAAGLYDYLSTDVARLLTRVLFDSTTVGGRLLIANFVPDHPGRAYMEAFMDWNLACRSPEEVRMLAAEIDERSVRDLQVFQPDRCVAYLELTKKASSNP